MKAKHLTPEHIGRIARIKIPSGAIVEATIRTVESRRSSADEGLNAKAHRMLSRDYGLVITVTFDELCHPWIGSLGGRVYNKHTDFRLDPSAPVTLLD